MSDNRKIFVKPTNTSALVYLSCRFSAYNISKEFPDEFTELSPYILLMQHYDTKRLDEVIKSHFKSDTLDIITLPKDNSKYLHELSHLEIRPYTFTRFYLGKFKVTEFIKRFNPPHTYQYLKSIKGKKYAEFFIVEDVDPEEGTSEIGYYAMDTVTKSDVIKELKAIKKVDKMLSSLKDPFELKILLAKSLELAMDDNKYSSIDSELRDLITKCNTGMVYRRGSRLEVIHKFYESYLNGFTI